MTFDDKKLMGKEIVAVANEDVSADYLAELNRTVSDECANVDFRIRLIILQAYHQDIVGYDFFLASRAKHVSWLVAHHPAHPFVGTPFCLINRGMDGDQSYEEVKRIWEHNISLFANDANILINAARFFDIDDKTSAKKILLQALALEPQNVEILEYIDSLNRRSR